MRWYTEHLMTGLLCIPLLSLGCQDDAMADHGSPVRAFGEVFFDDSSVRTRVSCQRPMAIRLCRIIDAGVPDHEMKDMGAAALTIVYSDGKEVQVLIGATGLVMRGRHTVQVDNEEMRTLLRQMQLECAVK